MVTIEQATQFRPRTSLGIREFALGIEELERFVRREPLRRVHECVVGECGVRFCEAPLFCAKTSDQSCPFSSSTARCREIITFFLFNRKQPRDTIRLIKPMLKRIQRSFFARNGTRFLTVIGLAIAEMLTGPALADGCFVFKWAKNIDINEPAQKAVIVHHAGREDLLLQVKYEGPLQEFGWLIPVPSLPKVEKGAMDAFYELSLLTQQHLMRNGWFGTPQLSRSDESAPEPPVKVIEAKTVGAYEIAVLSARDAGSLQRWLKSNGYSFPGEKAVIANEYIRKGWYFVAVKIKLPETPKELSAKKPGKSTPTAKERASIRKKLASGELHPLLISFDTPTCIFPLKISAVGGKPSEVLLYVLSEKPLCSRFLLDEGSTTINQRFARAEKEAASYAASRHQCLENNGVLNLSIELVSDLRTKPRADYSKPDVRKKWTVEDLQAIVREDPPTDQISLDDYRYATADELLHGFRVSTNQITKTARTMRRLKDNSWYLTKVHRTFLPTEMHDLEFKPAVPMLAETLAQPSGRAAGLVLASLGTDGASALLAACHSTNSTTRENAAFGLIGVHDPRTVEPLLILLKDQNARTRHNAVRAAANNWDKRFIPLLQGLFGDPYEEIRNEAVELTSRFESREQTDHYLSLLENSDAQIGVSALAVLCRLNPDAITAKPVCQLLRDANPDIQTGTLRSLDIIKGDIVKRSDLFPLLSSSRVMNIRLALNLIEGRHSSMPNKPAPSMPGDLPGVSPQGRKPEARERWLTSSEASVLTTNRFSAARLMGLGVLVRNADVKAVELLVNSLRDPNPVVREKAFGAIRWVTGQNISDDDAAKWESWWNTRKTTPARKTIVSPKVQSKAST